MTEKFQLLCGADATIVATDATDGRRWRWEIPEGVYVNAPGEQHLVRIAPPEPITLTRDDGTTIEIEPTLVDGERA